MKRGATRIVYFGLAFGLTTLPAYAFRTASDIPKFADTARVRWATDEVEYEINDRGAPGLLFGEVVETAQTALKVWSLPSCTNVHFHYRGSTSASATPDDGLNTVEWLSTGWSAHGFDPNAAGVTDVQYRRNASGKWEVVESDIYINAENFGWVAKGVPPEGKREVASLLLHESGHMLGLLHPCEPGGAAGVVDCAEGNFTASVMYPLYAPGRNQLGPDDEAGVCNLYPSVPDCPAGCPDGQRCDQGACHPVCGDALCGPQETCCANGCSATPCPASTGTQRCEADEDCAAAATCEQGRCLPASAGRDGEACLDARTCEGGACLEGYCTDACATDSDCGDGGALCIGEPTARGCLYAKKPFGASCSTGNECGTDQCVAREGTTTGHCSMLCGQNLAECPNRWSCATVDGADVCVPGADSPHGGCAFAARSSPCSPSTVFATCFAFALAARRRRRLYQMKKQARPAEALSR